jgi:hypothetical protein
VAIESGACRTFGEAAGTRGFGVTAADPGTEGDFFGAEKCSNIPGDLAGGFIDDEETDVGLPAVAATAGALSESFFRFLA